MKVRTGLIILLAMLLTIILIYTIPFIQNAAISTPVTYNTPEVSNGVSGSQSISEQLEDNNRETIISEEENNILNVLREQEVTFAILGTDERSDEIPRSDIIMVVRYMPYIDKLIVVSVPRDTRVTIPGKYVDKINHAYAFGGPSLLIETLNQFFNIEIDYYIKFSFENFRELIDAMGGVEVTVEKDFYYEGYIDLDTGTQILNGDDALDYVRFRYDSDGDMGRIKRQQQVIQSIIDNRSEGNQDNGIKLINSFYQDIKTDVEIGTMINYFKLIYDTEQMHYDMNTLETTGAYINDIYYGIYNEQDRQRLIGKLTAEVDGSENADE